jgi:hypothetical protein
VSYLSVEIASDRLLLAIAEEAALRDRDLDAIEHDLSAPNLDGGRAAALALTLGRAGRPTSRDVLAGLVLRLEQGGRTAEADATRLAIELLQLRPPPHVERADSGYRRSDPAGRGEELFVEDPIAAHWHHARRWGPPLRPDLDAPVIVAREAERVAEYLHDVREGRIVLVYFVPPHPFARPEPPLRLLRAGLTRDASLNTITRWSRIRSVGEAERRGTKRAAYERGDSLEVLPERASLPSDALIELMTVLLKDARE